MSSRSAKRTDYRLLRAKRESALDRPELRADPKPAALSQDQVAAAVAAGKFTRVPSKRRRL
jgi:hypothetical protein